MKTYRTYDEIPADVFHDTILDIAMENIQHTLSLPDVVLAVMEEYNNDALDRLCPDLEDE